MARLKYGDHIPSETPTRHIVSGGYVQLYWTGNIVCLEHRIKDGAVVPDELVGHHINGIRDDNRPENLEYMTSNEHRRLHARQGDGRQRIYDYDELARLYQSGLSYRQVSELTGAPAPSVGRALAENGITPRRSGTSASGRHWGIRQ